MTKQEADESKARCEAAAGEPWELGGCSGRMVVRPGYGEIADTDVLAHAEFIVHARSDLPAALEMLGRAMATLDVLSGIAQTRCGSEDRAVSEATALLREWENKGVR